MRKQESLIKRVLSELGTFALRLIYESVRDWERVIFALCRNCNII